MSMKVTIVCPLARTVTVAVPVPGVVLASNPGLGNVLTPANWEPTGIVSVIVTGPDGTRTGAPQEPPGAAPAATVTGVPPTLKAKFVPTGTPAPATLQT